MTPLTPAQGREITPLSFRPRSGAISNPGATNAKNLSLLIQLRWLAVAGQLATIIAVHGWMGISLPLPSMGCVLLGLAGLNLYSLALLRRRRPVTDAALFVELLIDMAALTVQLYLSGGAANPFVSLYLLQITLGAALLKARSTWILVGVAAACFGGLTRWFLPLGLAPHANDIPPDLHIQGVFICFLLAAALIVLFMSRINRNLRQRDAYLADLRQQSAEETHIVRMGLLASGAAHELGTPLSTISVILGDWRRMPQVAADPALIDDLANAQRQLDRCKAIVSGILMSSGEARGEGTLRTTVNGFLAGLAREWQAGRTPEAFDFDDRFAPDEPIISDAALKQVLCNVLDNAYEASPQWVGFTAAREDDRLVLTIEDAGPGFRPDILAALGKPYTSSKGSAGRGLGLFLVVNVIRKLGGQVVAENTADGARVTLTLPLAALTGDAAHAA